MALSYNGEKSKSTFTPALAHFETCCFCALCNKPIVNERERRGYSLCFSFVRERKRHLHIIDKRAAQLLFEPHKTGPSSLSLFGGESSNIEIEKWNEKSRGGDRRRKHMLGVLELRFIFCVSVFYGRRRIFPTSFLSLLRISKLCVCALPTLNARRRGDKKENFQFFTETDEKKKEIILIVKKLCLSVQLLRARESWYRLDNHTRASITATFV